ncbi:helix-turn-helix transcriptional regulator [Maritimibacter sp. 55A14]|uniref:helix-turn-helix transcriptional regulator n=1 Tax=Maritimibacter sp. 55A14 TaxID=2174844 RepID=UPI000D60F1E7|nr:helix-turn-helix transcriptional regulator [Maritimibacter sp. 55A14]PWE34302.1 helix-turn-helix transcriptional regulator [Maritimibacter sp. 55A14]
MPQSSPPPSREGSSRALALLIGVQAVCAVFFLGDVVADLVDGGGMAALRLHLVIEAIASIALIVGIAVELRFLLEMLRREQVAARSLAVASGALADVMQGLFRAWGLTAAERDVAAFTMKGLSIAEIAGLRGAAEGTVKSQLAAIYRKAGVSGRSQLVSLLIEDLMDAPLLAREGAQPGNGLETSGASATMRAGNH